MGKSHKKPRVLLLQATSKKDFDVETAEKTRQETKQLVDTWGGVVVKDMTQRLDHPHPKFYIGTGKLEELKQWVEAEEVDVVIIDGFAKSSQLFRIEKELWNIYTEIRVWDRIDLILHIFDLHATTVESQLQIKLARTTHMGPRIYGLGKTELSRQGGGVGTRGKGETNIEFERRQIKEDQQSIKKELKKLLKQKHKRLAKRNSLGIGPVALVGYTSAGKTTLFNTLTGKEKEMNKGLFTTLDTVVGKLKTPNFDQPILVSDTIGFISNLPPVLIESFKSTLLESLEAKLLLHVVDLSDAEIIEKILVVHEILQSLKAQQPRFLVLNKSDLVSKQQQQELQKNIEVSLDRLDAHKHYTKIIRVSAETQDNMQELIDEIEFFFESRKNASAADTL